MGTHRAFTESEGLRRRTITDDALRPVVDAPVYSPNEQMMQVQHVMVSLSACSGTALALSWKSAMQAHSAPA
ncbi:hypothetical protein Bsp3421_004247 [Burkholderia sp. FERM BP-3421]|jgi:hypothetical protein|uniref:hypothetical protein n=1 Tax=Burkholderia sp. FERM BP-3421 TaxID=1494466 RepID=UPI002360EE78|nr:hypothetical protein [Burkholderia sp. FERM BP-3421]WDD94136.1 hypothetical protein Bsp3421_004247 [Burkholderia sp. FERM BP-3421]